MAASDSSPRPDPPGAPAPSGVSRALLAVAVAVGALRLVRLGEWSLWHDEVLTLHDALRWLDGGGVLPSHPLGVASIAAVLRGSGAGWPDEWILRILPALLGWLTIPLTYLALRRWIGANRAALAALLVAASTWHVYWSQNARYYTLAQALVLAGAWLYGAGLGRASTWRLLGGLALMLLSGLAHLSGLLVAAGLVGVVLLAPALGFTLPGGGQRARRALLAVGLPGLLVALGLGWRKWAEYSGKKGIAIFEGLGSVFEGCAHFALTTGYYVTPLLGVAALVGAVYGWRAGRGFDRANVALVVGVVVIAAAASTVALVNAQYVFVLLPWIAALATAPLDAEPLRRGGPAAGFAALLVLPALASTALYFAVHHGERPRWRDAYRYVWNHRGPEDLVLGLASPVGEYYLNPGRRDLRNPQRVARLDAYNSEIPGLWRRYARRTWFVVQRERLDAWWPDQRREMLEQLANDCRLVAEFPLVVGTRDLSLAVYVRD